MVAGSSPAGPIYIGSKLLTASHLFPARLPSKVKYAAHLPTHSHYSPEQRRDLDAARRLIVRDMPPSSSAVSVAKGASILLIQGVIVNIFSLLTFFVAARGKLLTVEQIGAAFALSLVALSFATVGSLALPQAAMKFIPDFLGKGLLSHARGVSRRLIITGAALATLLAILCYFASAPIAQYAIGDSSQMHIVQILALEVFALVYATYLQGNLYGQRRFKRSAMITILGNVVKFVAVVLFLTAGFGVLGMVQGWVVGDITMTVLLLAASIGSFRGEATPQPLSSLLRYSLPLYGAATLTFASQYIDRYIVLFLAGLRSLGIYSAALAGASYVSLFSEVIGTSLFPQLSELHGRHGREVLKESSVKASRYVALLYVPLCIGLAALSFQVITLFLGPDFSDGWLPMAIIGISLATVSMAVVVNSLLLSLGSTRIFFWGNLVGIATGLGSAIVLVTLLREPGAAISRLLLVLVLFLVPVWKLRKEFGLYLDWSAIKKTVAASAGMGLVLVAVQMVSLSLWLFPAYILLGLATYLLLLRFMKVVTAKDAELVKRLLPARLGFIVDYLYRILA